MNNIILSSLMQLLAQSPVLLVYLAGVILALVFWRRCPTPSLLVLAASALLLLLTVTQPFLTQYLVLASAGMDWTRAKLGWMLSAVALTMSFLRAAALGLLLAAAFLHRGVPSSLGPNKAPPGTATTPGS